MAWRYNPFTGTLDRVGGSTTSTPAESTTQVVSTLKNNNGGSIAGVTPVVVDNLGGIDIIDVASFSNKTLGVTTATVGSGSNGEIILSGIIENVSIGFNKGEQLFVSKSGGLTNVEPSVGVNGFVAGDALIIVGEVTENSTTPANKDLLVNIRFIAELS